MILTDADYDAIERAIPPTGRRPRFDVPRFWSNTALEDRDTIIALVLDRPTTEDLARTIVAYGPRQVMKVLTALGESGEFTPEEAERAARWVRPIMRGVADAARELAAA